MSRLQFSADRFMSSGVSAVPGSVKYNSSVQRLWQWRRALWQLPGQILPLATPACVLAPALSHTRRRQHLLPGQPAARCAAAVAVAITSSALLQCCSAAVSPGPSTAAGPRHDQQQTAAAAAVAGPGLLPSPGYFPRTGQNSHPGHLKWNTQFSFLFC